MELDKTVSPMDIEKCPKCDSPIIMVEYSYGSPKSYDGVSEIICPRDAESDISLSHWRIGRWCGQELVGHQSENPHCDGKESHNNAN